MRNYVHTLVYRGHRFDVEWVGPKKDKKRVTLVAEYSHGVYFNKMKLKYWMDNLIREYKKQQARNARIAYLKRLPLVDLLKHPEFAYSRFVPSFVWGEKAGDYKLYFRDPESPTGVSLVKVIPSWEWEIASNKAGVQHKYLSPTEKA